jgi:hypothetical protein
MKKRIFLSVILMFALLAGSHAQEKTVKYFSGGTEFIFNFASIDNDGVEGGNVMRFTGFLNLQGNFNFDFNKSFGVFTGLSLRNVGFIYNDQSTGLKKKYRTYNVGIPFGFKLGSMNRTLLFAGYEIEFPTNYKEKTFQNEVKMDKFNVWFSNRVPVFYNTVFVGMQFKYGFSLKFKYYLTNFFNQSFTEVQTNGVQVQPYEDVDVRMFYFSLSFNLFKGSHFTYTKEEILQRY